MEFHKIRSVNFRHHIDFTIDGNVVNVSKRDACAIAYALSHHNVMVERLKYLEDAVESFNKTGIIVNDVSKVAYVRGCAYTGSGFEVIAGRGKAPRRFVGVTSEGVRFTAVHRVETRGGGHGEGAAYAVESYKIEKEGGGWITLKDNEVCDVVEILEQ